MGEDALYIMLEKARVLDLNINILGSNMVIKGQFQINFQFLENVLKISKTLSDDILENILSGNNRFEIFTNF